MSRFLYFVILLIISLTHTCCAQPKGETKVVAGNYVDFTYAAEHTINAVVHISAEMEQKHSTWDLFFQDHFFNPFGSQSHVYQAYGSGVIITENGYIVTNNHVVEGAQKITITLNDKRTFEAELIGTDAINDLALLKIDAQGLQTVSYGNSDDLRIGEWVLAVGNPFNLTSTVTAGIVSAKARNLNMLNEVNQVSTYIQTDAAVNSGNSGGALVNAKGELVGINAAIASNTGSYTGYSFAIPVNIVKKVVNDLKNYGKVQRVYFGASFLELTAENTDQSNTVLKGIQVVNIEKNLSAEEAGFQENDILLSIDDKEVNAYAELKEILEQHIPGDVIKCHISRNGKSMNLKMTLKNRKGTTDMIKNQTGTALSVLGIETKAVSNNIRASYGINAGLEVTKIHKGILQQAGIKEGFIITAMDGKPISSEKDIDAIVNNKEGNIIVEGFYPGQRITYIQRFNITI